MGNGPFGTGTDLLERGQTSGNRKWPWCRTLGCVNKIEKSLNSLIINHLRVKALFVRAKGLEPLHRKAPDPKSGLSTNFNTPAFICYLPPQVTCHWLPLLVNCHWPPAAGQLPWLDGKGKNSLQSFKNYLFLKT